jgi:hypothetical protein
VIEC